MCFICSAGLPVPEVHHYPPSSDNTVKTLAKMENIFMEFMGDTKLSNVWMELEELDIILILRQFTQLESRIMSIPFLAGRSLYYTKDLEKVAGRMGIPLNNESFCISPDTRLHMWYRRRSQLNIDKGPCMLLSAFSFVELSGTNQDYR
jgi:hypothetical protein